MVQSLRLCDAPAGGTGSIPGQGTKIPHAAAKKKRKKFFLSTRGGILVVTESSVSFLYQFPYPGCMTVL